MKDNMHFLNSLVLRLLFLGSFIFGINYNSEAQCRSAFTYATKCKFVQFTSQHTANPGPVEFRWDFGDQQIDSVENPNHTYQLPGTYEVIFTVMNVDRGKITCIDSITQTIKIDSFCCQASFGSRLVQSYPDSVRYVFNNFSRNYNQLTWHFGDGGTSNDTNPFHTYRRNNSPSTFTVCLYVEDSSNGCKDTACQSIFVGVNPCTSNAEFTYSSDSFTSIFSFNSNDTSSRLFHEWDFGDQKTSTLANPTHQYNSIDNFVVTHLVYELDSTNNRICEDSIAQTISVPPRPSCWAKFQAAVDTSEKYKIYFLNQSVANPDSIIWDMGDGTTYTTQKPKHRYQKFGKYLVTLSIFKDNCSNSYSDSVGMDSDGKLLKAEGFEVEVIDDIFVGIPDFNIDQFKVYPNPFKNELHLKSSFDLSKSYIEIIDLQGRIIPVNINRFNSKHLKISTDQIRQGIYFIRIQNKEQAVHLKVVKW